MKNTFFISLGSPPTPRRGTPALMSLFRGYTQDSALQYLKCHYKQCVLNSVISMLKNHNTVYTEGHTRVELMNFK